MRTRKLSAYEREELLRDFRRGRKINDIARKLGRHPETVRRIAHEHGLRRRKGRQKLSTEDAMYIREALALGETRKALAERYGVNVVTIGKIARREAHKRAFTRAEIEHAETVAASLWRKGARQVLSLDDYKQMAMLGLMRAADTWDPDGGASFETWIGHKVRSAVLDEVRKETRVKRTGQFRERGIGGDHDVLEEA